MRGPNLNFASDGRRMMSVPKRILVVLERMGEFKIQIHNAGLSEASSTNELRHQTKLRHANG